jgi:uncharacterized protein
MLEVIEKLLILQERDRKILKVKDELVHIPYEQQDIESKYAAATAALEKAKLRAKQIESDRKELELEVDAKKQLIEKYSIQQFQTKKNEEFRALAKEIETCKTEIHKIEDRQLELMEQAEGAEKAAKGAQLEAAEVKRHTESRVADLLERQKNLKKELADLETNREQLAQAVDEIVLNRYERLLQNKGNNVVVGVQHGVCGGCHMLLNRQVVVHCQAQQEVFTCPNCGRILYYSSEMDLTPAD